MIKCDMKNLYGSKGSQDPKKNNPVWRFCFCCHTKKTVKTEISVSTGSDWGDRYDFCFKCKDHEKNQDTLYYTDNVVKTFTCQEGFYNGSKSCNASFCHYKAKYFHLLGNKLGKTCGYHNHFTFGADR